MANNTETFVISLKDKNFLKGLVAADRKTDETKGKVRGLSGAVGHLRTALAGVSVAFLGREIVTTLSDFERFEAVLTNTLGSNSAAQKAIEQITDFAATTPFAVDKLTDSYVKLANQGFVPTQSEMRKLGDLAASTGKDFDQLTEAVIDGQVGEFERLKEFGIRAKKSGDNVAFTFKGVTKNVAFTEKAMRGYILSLGDAQGVSGSMAAISKTTGGQISNLGDAVTQLMLNIGTKLKPVISGTIQVLGFLVEKMGEFINWLSEGGVGATILIAAVVGLGTAFLTFTAYTKAQALWAGILTIKTWALNTAMYANPVGLVVAGIVALIAVIVIVARKFTGWGKAWGHTLKGAKLALKAWGSSVKTYFTGVINGLMIGINVIKKGWFAFKNAVGLGNKEENDAFIAEINANTDARKKAIVDSAKETAGLAKESIKEFKLAAASIKLKEEKKEDEAAVNGKKTVTSTTGGGTGNGKTKGLGAGISAIKASAPKTFNINIGSLIKEQKISTTNLQETSMRIKEAVTKVLLTAVNDAQIIAE